MWNLSTQGKSNFFPEFSSLFEIWPNLFVFGNFNIHHKDWLIYSGRNDRPGELCYKWPMTLLIWLNFLLRSLAVALTVLLFWIFFHSSDASIYSTMAFPPLGNSDCVVVSVSIDFPKNTKWNAPFYCIAYDYSCPDWDSLCDHLRDVPLKDIFKLSASAATSVLVNFLSRFRLELMCIFLIVSIRSNLTHLHLFQLLVLLP